MTLLSGLIELDGVTPTVRRGVWIAPTALVIGNVILEQDSSVFYQSVIRADLALIRVGCRTNLQDGVVVHTDPDNPALIGNGVSVGHKAILHGCVVGDDSLIGMGSMVMNGAVIGAGSLVAAGALVLEGTEIPPGSVVVGVPGRVRGEVSKELSAKIRRNADTYVELALRHARATWKGGHWASVS